MADITNQIMEERIEIGVEMVKKLAKSNNIVFNESLLIKGIEIGISLFIEKNRSYRSQQISKRYSNQGEE